MNAPTVLLRFNDLQARGIVRNREQLRNLQRDHGFPAGFLLSANARVFDQAEVEAWLQARREASVGAPQTEAA